MSILVLLQYCMTAYASERADPSVDVAVRKRRFGFEHLGLTANVILSTSWDTVVRVVDAVLLAYVSRYSDIITGNVQNTRYLACWLWYPR